MIKIEDYLEPCKKLAVIAFGPKATCSIEDDSLEFKIGESYVGNISTGERVSTYSIRKMPRWIAVKTVYDPGNREQPPEWNDEELGGFDRFDQAFLSLAMHYAREILGNVIEMVFETE